MTDNGGERLEGEMRAESGSMKYLKALVPKLRDQLAEREAEITRLRNELGFEQEHKEDSYKSMLQAIDKLEASESREQRLREALRESTWMLTNLAGLAQRSGYDVEHVDKQVEINGPLLEALNPSPAKEPEKP